MNEADLEIGQTYTCGEFELQITNIDDKEVVSYTIAKGGVVQRNDARYKKAFIEGLEAYGH